MSAISKRQIKNIVTAAMIKRIATKAKTSTPKVETIAVSRNMVYFAMKYALTANSSYALIDANGMNDFLPYLEVEINLKEQDFETYNYLLKEDGQYDYWIFIAE